MVSLNYLASHSRNLESILQTYRQIDLTIQSFFLIMGTFLLPRILEASLLHVALFFEFLLVSLSFFSFSIMRRFQKIIITRGEDVNWWHRLIVKAEQSFPPEERSFTQFKVHQNEKRFSADYLNRFLSPADTISDEDIDNLLGADQDQIRKVINTYIIKGMQVIWILILILSFGGITGTIYQ